MFRAVPLVEIPDYADAGGLGRPHREADATPTLVSDRMRAQLVVDTFVFTFTEEVEINIAEYWWEFFGSCHFRGSAACRAESLWLSEEGLIFLQREAEPRVIFMARNGKAKPTA